MRIILLKVIVGIFALNFLIVVFMYFNMGGDNEAGSV